MQTALLHHTQPDASVPLRNQVLMIDADDTLWENNIFFEQAIDRFIAMVAHPELSPQEVRSALDRLEAVRVKSHGYGTEAFHASLLASFEHLTGTACNAEQAHHVAACAGHIRSSDMVLLHGVAETLVHLAKTHTLLLVTKGDHAEQTAKLLRSNLADHFTHVEVLREKHTSAYRALLDHYGFDPARTWMIGNSPRSDINPALAAGMHAVYLPHHSTWVLEQEPIAPPPPGRRFLHLLSFTDLLHHFA
ncbi:MAG: HAD family hydrolase [Janthinobacterium lividum]